MLHHPIVESENHPAPPCSHPGLQQLRDQKNARRVAGIPCGKPDANTGEHEAAVRFLRSVPKPSVFSKFLRGPNQADHITDGATDHDARGPVVSSEDECTDRDNHSAD